MAATDAGAAGLERVIRDLLAERDRAITRELFRDDARRAADDRFVAEVVAAALPGGLAAVASRRTRGAGPATGKGHE